MALKRDQPVSVRLSAAEIAAIDEVARRQGVNRSEYVREVLISVLSEPDPVASEAAQPPETLQNERELAADKLASEILANKVVAVIQPNLNSVAKSLEANQADRPVSLSLQDLLTIGLMLLSIHLVTDFGPEIAQTLLRMIQSQIP